MNNKKTEIFDPYDLEIFVKRIDGNCTCNMKVGDKFYMKGGKISLPLNQGFCLYALQSAVPLLPAKQRKNHPADRIETDDEVTCPDPACKLIIEIKRKKLRQFEYNNVNANPLK